MYYKDLTNNNVNTFKQDGVIHLSNILPENMLISLINSAVDVQREALQRKTPSLIEHANITLDIFSPVVNRIMHFHCHAGPSQLALLGYPALEKIAQQLCGGEVIPTADMMIFKHQGHHARIPWHQDFIDEIKVGRIITIGIYLDDSNINDGGVQFINGSHKRKEDVCAFEHGAKQEADKLEFNVKAGDIIIHDPMIVHRSNTLLGQSMRRTLYYEFRTIEHVKLQTSWPDKFLAYRKALMNMARQQYQHSYPEGQQPKPYNEKFTDDLNVLSIESAYEVLLPKISANYCQCE